MVPEDAGEISRSLIKLEGTKPAKLSQILMIMYFFPNTKITATRD